MGLEYAPSFPSCNICMLPANAQSSIENFLVKMIYHCYLSFCWKIYIFDKSKNTNCEKDFIVIAFYCSLLTVITLSTYSLQNGLNVSDAI